MKNILICALLALPIVTFAAEDASLVRAADVEPGTQVPVDKIGRLRTLNDEELAHLQSGGVNDLFRETPAWHMFPWNPPSWRGHKPPETKTPIYTSVRLIHKKNPKGDILSLKQPDHCRFYVLDGATYPNEALPKDLRVDADPE